MTERKAPVKVNVWQGRELRLGRVKRALRSTLKQDEPVQTETVQQAATPNAAPWQPKIRVYRTPANAIKPQAELVLGPREAAHLGGAGAKVSVLEGEDGAWHLRPDPAGALTLMKHGTVFRVRCLSLAAIIPPTGRTEVPARVDGGSGFIVYPAAVVPEAARHRSAGAVASKPAKPAAAIASSLTPYADAKRQAAAPSLDDLKTALEMLRTIATELGAELYLDDGAVVRARIVI